MNFFDDPAHQPPDPVGIRPGETAQGTITMLNVKEGRFGRLALTWELDHDGRERWANARLWKAMAAARLDVGDMARITRGPDEPNPSGKPSTTWTVERLTPTPTTRPTPTFTPASAPAPAPAGAAGHVQRGPSW